MPLIVQEAVNLICGDDAANPEASKHHNLESIQLPTLEDVTTEHHAGGSYGAVQLAGFGIKAFEPTFKLKGHDLQVMSMFGLPYRSPFTVYGLLRDKAKQRAVEVKSVLECKLTKYAPDDFKRGDDFGHDCAMMEVFRYAIYLDNAEHLYFDYLSSQFRVNGQDRIADERRILRLPGS